MILCGSCIISCIFMSTRTGVISVWLNCTVIWQSCINLHQSQSTEVLPFSVKHQHNVWQRLHCHFLSCLYVIWQFTSKSLIRMSAAAPKIFVLIVFSNNSNVAIVVIEAKVTSSLIHVRFSRRVALNRDIRQQNVWYHTSQSEIGQLGLSMKQTFRPQCRDLHQWWWSM